MTSSLSIMLMLLLSGLQIIDSLHKDAHNDEAMPQHTEHYKDGQHMDGFDHESVLGKVQF